MQSLEIQRTFRLPTIKADDYLCFLNVELCTHYSCFWDIIWHIAVSFILHTSVKLFKNVAHSMYGNESPNKSQREHDQVI